MSPSRFTTIKILILALTPLCLTCCTKQPPLGPERPLQNGECIEIQYNLRTPRSSSNATRLAGAPALSQIPSRATTLQQEEAIDQAYVFFISATTGRVRDVAKAQHFESDGAGKKFTVSLNIEGVETHEFDSYVLANIGDFIAKDDIDALRNLTYAELQARLKAPINEVLQSGSNNFVMWGKSPSRISTSSQGRITVPMLRAVASVNIGVGASNNGIWDGNDGEGRLVPFTLQQIYVYNAYDHYSFMPLSQMYNPVTKQVTGPSLTGNFTEFPLEYNVKGGIQISHEIYLPDSPVLMKEGAISGDENHINRCAIVVGGLYNGSTTPTYYRLDFNDNNSPKQLVDVLRNHKYTINIVSVIGEGSATPDEAYKLKAMKLNMIAEWQVSGDPYVNIGQDSGIIGSESDEGIIFWGDPDDPESHYKVAAKVDQPSATWASQPLYYKLIGARSMVDGRANIEVLRRFSAAAVDGASGDFAVDFPVANACHTYRGPSGSDPVGTWYLPAIEEMYDFLMTSKDIPSSPWWDPLQRNVNDYFSSTEVEVSGAVWFIRISTLDKQPRAGKWELGGGIRCIRNVTKPARVGETRAGGVIFWVDPADPTNYKVVSMIDQATTVPDTKLIFASPELSSVSVPKANSRNNGYINQLEWINKSNTVFPPPSQTPPPVPPVPISLDINYPVVAACYNYRGPYGADDPGTWYLPAIDELVEICKFKDGFDILGIPNWVNLVRVNGYFSSTENSDTNDRVWYMAMLANSVVVKDDGGKWDNGCVRCIRGR